MKKIMVVIPLRPYKVWIARCEPQSPQYRHLTNGIIVRRADGQEEVQILCDEKRARDILDYAARVCPEVAPFITRITDSEI